MIDAISSQLGGIPREGVIALFALLTLQVVMQLFACVDLARRRTVRGGRKWVWVLVIVAGSIPGAALYLGLGRKPDAAEPDSDTHEQAGATGRDALDRLYGPKSGNTR